MNIWFRRLAPTVFTGLILLGIYLIWPQHGNDAVKAPLSPPAGLAAYVAQPEPKAIAPLQFADGQGKSLSLADFRGRVVLLNIWATWCGPCRREMPDLAKLQQKLGGPDFEVVAVSMDLKGAEASAAFLKETGAEALKLYIEPTGKILSDLKSVGLPTTLLINREGQELGRLLGPADWSSPEAVALIEAALKP